jgi:hypothetical protein
MKMYCVINTTETDFDIGSEYLGEHEVIWATVLAC